MNHAALFNILDRVDSTNNYAMAMVHEGMARPGEAWFAHEQTAGKGQRGKQWLSTPGSSLLLSIAIQPGPVFTANPFHLSAIVALTTKKFLDQHTHEIFHIKWPNDLYWRDRKTGGILIETKYSGATWVWAIIGIGINVKPQNLAAAGLLHATSLEEITANSKLNTEQLAKQLHQEVLHAITLVTDDDGHAMAGYNASLYKKNETVRLRKGSIVFETEVKEVNRFGQLITEDKMQRVFNHGEIEWLNPD